MGSGALAGVAQVSELVDVEAVEAVGSNSYDDPGDDQRRVLVVLVEQQLALDS